MPLLPLQPD
jgi:hypothetical protein